MTRGGFLETLTFSLRRPPEFMIGRAKEFSRREIEMEKSEVNGVEFEEDHLEVVRLTVNPH